jgi:hypothetical protein
MGIIDFDLSSIALGYVAGVFLCWSICETWRTEK